MKKILAALCWASFAFAQPPLDNAHKSKTGDKNHPVADSAMSWSAIKTDLNRALRETSTVKEVSAELERIVADKPFDAKFKALAKELETTTKNLKAQKPGFVNDTIPLEALKQKGTKDRLLQEALELLAKRIGETLSEKERATLSINQDSRPPQVFFERGGEWHFIQLFPTPLMLAIGQPVKSDLDGRPNYAVKKVSIDAAKLLAKATLPGSFQLSNLKQFDTEMRVIFDPAAPDTFRVRYGSLFAGPGPERDPFAQQMNAVKYFWKDLPPEWDAATPEIDWKFPRPGAQ